MSKVKLIDKKLIRTEFYTTEYFKKTYKILKSKEQQKSTFQFKSFSTEPYMVCGIYESIELIKTYLSKKDFESLEIKYFNDGTIIKPNQCVLSITGDYRLICKLENIIDSILARRSSVATNCYQFLKYLSPEKLIFMSDRSDDYHLHPYDGYAAYIAGVRSFSNESHVYFISNKNDVNVIGTMPHALIQQYHGDIVKVYHSFKQKFPNDKIVMLVDYDNDVIGTLEKLKPYLNDIWGLRIDTSQKIIDKSIKNKSKKNYGASALLFKNIKQWLIKNNIKHIKLICSSGNDLDKIKEFTKNNIPVDIYGIGTSLNKLSLHFTADLVKIDNQLEAKFGRSYISTKNMKDYKNEKPCKKY